MELIVISNPSFFKGEALLINELFELGMQRFHLRKEVIDRQAYQQLLTEIDPRYWERIVLHQQHKLAPEFGIHRLHFKEHQRSEGLHKAFKKKSYTLSTSTHKHNQITDLQNFKYSFIGPVFQSISKENYPGIFPENFKLNYSGTTKLIALGGISASKIDLLQQMNFEGAAVLGAIWNEPEQATANFKQLQKVCQTTDLT